MKTRRRRAPSRVAPRLTRTNHRNCTSLNRLRRESRRQERKSQTEPLVRVARLSEACAHLSLPLFPTLCCLPHPRARPIESHASPRRARAPPPPPVTPQGFAADPPPRHGGACDSGVLLVSSREAVAFLLQACQEKVNDAIRHPSDISRGVHVRPFGFKVALMGNAQRVELHPQAVG